MFCDLRHSNSSTEPEHNASLTNCSNCHSSSETLGWVGKKTDSPIPPTKRSSFRPPLHDISKYMKSLPKKILLCYEVHGHRSSPCRGSVDDHMIRVSSKLPPCISTREIILHKCVEITYLDDILLYPAQEKFLVEQPCIKVPIRPYFLTG